MEGLDRGRGMIRIVKTSSQDDNGMTLQTTAAVAIDVVHLTGEGKDMTLMHLSLNETEGVMILMFHLVQHQLLENEEGVETGIVAGMILIPRTAVDVSNTEANTRVTADVMIRTQRMAAETTRGGESIVKDAMIRTQKKIMAEITTNGRRIVARDAIILTLKAVTATANE